jgi:hypothetical protein
VKRVPEILAALTEGVFQKHALIHPTFPTGMVEDPAVVELVANVR